MNKDLDTIFLQIDPDEDTEPRDSEATWCVDMIDGTDIEYTRSGLLHEMLDEEGIIREVTPRFRDTSYQNTIVLSVQGRFNILIAQLHTQKSMRELYEKKAREAQGSEIASMVRHKRSEQLSEEEGPADR